MSAIAAGVAVAVAGCGGRAPARVGDPPPSGATGGSVVAQTVTAHIAVTVAGGCPATLGHAGDVTNNATGLRHHLLPLGQQPSAGLVCRYQVREHDGRAATQLLRTVSLGSREADGLASVIARVSLARPRGVFGCPAAEVGTDTVIAFSYAARRTADLWYYASGCRTLDNGYVQAFQAGNPSFYGAFESAFAAVMRH